MDRKTALITGGNAGIGLAIAKKLLQWNENLRICLACRNEAKAEKAIKHLKQENATADVRVLIIDVSSLESVYRAAKEIKKNYDHLDYLYLNAGIMPVSTVDWANFWSGLFSKRCAHMLATGEGLLKQVDGSTPDDLKQIFATNLFGHFVLIKELEERLGGPDRTTQIIWTSSSNAKKESLCLTDIQHCNGCEPYSSSKYAADLISVALNEKFNKQGVYSHTTCPGLVLTNLTYGILPRWMWILLIPIMWLLRVLTSNMTASPENGAEALFWLVTQQPQKLDPMSKYHSSLSITGRSYTKSTKMDIDPADAVSLYNTLDKMEQQFSAKFRNVDPANEKS